MSSEQELPIKTDGRALRSERSRQLIIDAVYELIEAGILVPTAQQVAERAEVGIRTVFRHFNDMERLLNTMDQRMEAVYVDLFGGGDREGSLADRILHAAERYATAYEALSNLILSTHSQLWRVESARNNYARGQRRLRKDLEVWLPEVSELASTERESVDAVASFENWHRLRAHQGLSKKRATGVVVLMLSLLLKVPS